MCTEGNFVRANIIKEKKNELYKILHQQKIKYINNRQKEEKDFLMKKQLSELNEFNSLKDSELIKLKHEFEKEKQKFIEKHKKELNEYQHKHYHKKVIDKLEPLSNREINELNNKIKYFVNKKDYKNAHICKAEIIKIINQEKNLKTKNINNSISVQKLQNSYTKSKDFLEQKYTLKYNEFKKQRAIAFEQLLLKYKQQCNYLDTKHLKENNQIKNHSNESIIKCSRREYLSQRKLSRMPSLANSISEEEDILL